MGNETQKNLSTIEVLRDKCKTPARVFEGLKSIKIGKLGKWLLKKTILRLKHSF